MFDFGGRYSELMVLLVVAIVFIRPKDLPVVLRKLGQFMNKIRGMAREFQGHVDVAMKDAGMADIKNDLQGLGSGLSGALAAPQPTPPVTPVTPTIAPALPQFSSFSAASDFSDYFGSNPKAGETWVAGRRISPATSPAP